MAEEYQNYDNQGSGNIDNNSDDSEGGEDEVRMGGKRRSKNDNAGRDFKCKYCDKTYLSYPALYTHMKQKHSKGPDGELRNPPTSGRGRGRPRKNPYQRLDPRTEDFFKAPEREGGPVDPLCCFKVVFTTIFSFSQQLDQDQLNKNMKEYPIFKHLIQFSNMVDPQGNFIDKDCDSKGKEENKKTEEKPEEKELAKEGGEEESEAYEGGDSQNDRNGNQNATSDGKQSKPAANG